MDVAAVLILPGTDFFALLLRRPYNLTFYGVGLAEETLKDWLRKCGRQRPSKKNHKTRSSLSRAEINAIQVKTNLKV